MLSPDRIDLLLSPPEKRKLARMVFGAALVWLVLAVFFNSIDYRTRKAAGYDPLTTAAVVTMVAPLGLLLIGCWIGWGRVSIDRRAGVVLRKPLGPFFPGRSFSLADASLLHVGYLLGPTTPPSGYGYSVRKRRVFWFVRAEGKGTKVMLIRQRTRAEALAEAKQIGEFLRLPVEVDDSPPD